MNTLLKYHETYQKVCKNERKENRNSNLVSYKVRFEIKEIRFSFKVHSFLNESI